MGSIDTMINSMANKINEIGSSKKVESIKKYAEKTKIKLIDDGMSLISKIGEFKNSLIKKNE